MWVTEASAKAMEEDNDAHGDSENVVKQPKTENRLQAGEIVDSSKRSRLSRRRCKNILRTLRWVALLPNAVVRCSSLDFRSKYTLYIM
jgi:hypothetical protein